MYLKVTSTLRQQTPKQDPFLRCKQSRLLDVSLERYSDNARPEVVVSLCTQAWSFRQHNRSLSEYEVPSVTGAQPKSTGGYYQRTSERSIKVTDTFR